MSNVRSGLEFVVAADFEVRIIRYDYQQVSAKSAGVPEGGILAMRQARSGTGEFYSADQQLTSEETREILLQPLLPPHRAA